MNARVEGLVEDYNEARERVVDARRRQRAARKQLGRRLWTINTGGAPSTLASSSLPTASTRRW